MDLVENVNLLEHIESSNQTNTNTNLVICKNCKREVYKLNTKRIFGQKNVYECKANELKNCKEILYKETEILYKETEIMNLKNKKKMRKTKKILMMNI